MNAIVFYSNSIFEEAGIPPNVGTAITQTVSWLATLITAYMLKCFGRKTLLVVNYILLAFIGAGMSLADHWGQSTAMLILTITFVTVFQFAPGPVTWLYTAEVCEAKGVSAGTTVNLIFTLVIGLTTESLINHWTKEWTFMMFSGFNIIAAIVLAVFAKESNGKSE
jgi:Na+/melibiose symporter-like transporter